MPVFASSYSSYKALEKYFIEIPESKNFKIVLKDVAELALRLKRDQEKVLKNYTAQKVGINWLNYLKVV